VLIATGGGQSTGQLDRAMVGMPGQSGGLQLLGNAMGREDLAG